MRAQAVDLWVDPNVGGKSGVGALKESHLIYMHADGLTHCTFRLYLLLRPSFFFFFSIFYFLP